MIKKKSLKNQILLRYVCNNKHKLKKKKLFNNYNQLTRCTTSRKSKDYNRTPILYLITERFFFTLYYTFCGELRKSLNKNLVIQRQNDFVQISLQSRKIFYRHTYISIIIVINKYVTKIFKYKHHN